MTSGTTGAGGFGTTPEEMARAGARAVETDEHVQAELAGLRSRLTPLAGTWRGEAAATFEALMARWDADARALSAALGGIGEAITGAGRTYRQAEEEQSASLSAIRAALG
ncbi:hypothetical protein GCM10023215_65640 [Pseudonocardia yuanmonensis]|uniref:ESAT-6-like protein n=1 Tax=Pseudonocardia yuanmonensis TaxID=1095914 RepID=A0ABP8XUE4_9PSEU